MAINDNAQGRVTAHERCARLAADLAKALRIVDEVDGLTLPRFNAADFAVDEKPDLTPVTNIDREAEALIRARIREIWPEDSIYGEEGGSSEGSGGTSRRWIIDPIDGTKNFVRGTPAWATLLALEEEGEIVVGVVSAPALGRRWWASLGGGAFTGPTASGVGITDVRQIHVSGVCRLHDASFSYSSLSGWEARGLLGGFLGLASGVWRTRAYGDFWSYMMVAEGVVDIAAEPELELYDMAALVPIVTEAGGCFTSLDGAIGPWGGDALASNAILHDDALAALASKPQSATGNG